MKRKYRNNDADFDSRGLLKDQRSYRASMRFMDSDMPRVPNAENPQTERPLISDGRTGNPLNLHRPGFRVAARDARAPVLCSIMTDAGTQAKNRAYADYETQLRDAYKTPPGFGSDDTITGAGSHGPRGAKEGTPCTKDGWPGVLKRGAEGKMFCD